FEEGASNGHVENEEEEEEEEGEEEDDNGDIIRNKKKRLKEHIPYHDMADVKDKFEKGIEEKPKAEKRLDVRVQSGMASTKKQQFEHGEFEQEIEPKPSKTTVDVELLSGAASERRTKFERGEFEQEVESHISKVVVDTDLLSGAASERRERFEKGELENRIEKTTTIDIPFQSGAASERKAKFEKGEFEQEIEPHVAKVKVDVDLLSGAASEKKAKFERGEFDDHEHVQKHQVEPVPSGLATEKKQKFESGQVDNDVTLVNQRENLAQATIEPGNAQAKREEFMSKITSDTAQQRTGDKYIDMNTLEQGSATSKRKGFESLATSEFKATDKTKVEVEPGFASNLKEQYLSTVTSDSTSAKDKDQQLTPQAVVASGLAKERANVFENPDDTAVKRTVEIDNDLASSGVAKERVAMFKNLESGTSGKRGNSPPSTGDSKLRVDNIDFSDKLINMSIRLKIKDHNAKAASAAAGEVSELPNNKT
ncbi:unnamed protein product, partial [Didymodactylos carnosus]